MGVNVKMQTPHVSLHKWCRAEWQIENLGEPLDRSHVSWQKWAIYSYMLPRATQKKELLNNLFWKFGWCLDCRWRRQLGDTTYSTVLNWRTINKIQWLFLPYKRFLIPTSNKNNALVQWLIIAICFRWDEMAVLEHRSTPLWAPGCDTDNLSIIMTSWEAILKHGNLPEDKSKQITLDFALKIDSIQT